MLARRTDSACVSPLVSPLRQQRAARVLHEALSVRRDFHRDVPAITLHPRVILPSSISTFSKPKNLCSSALLVNAVDERLQ
jgi:hypothetical protein